MNKIHPVILCGGGGTRLWPKSRASHPKPFHRLVGDATLFEQTLDRLQGERFAAPLIVAGEAHVDLICASMRESPSWELVVEPAARNTAPAIALAAARLDPKAVMVVCPSDHHIADLPEFHAAIARAAELAGSGWLVTLGINPTGPETGFGYIERGAALGEGAFKVQRFVEKPDLATAERFLESGTFSWNSGIFLFEAGVFLEQLALHRPAMAQAARRSVAEGGLEANLFHPAAFPFAEIEGESVDYAVMEHAERVAVVPVSMGWSDIGNWQALRDAQVADANGNASQGQAELIDCEGVFAVSDGPRISAIGLEDVIIVVDGDEVLVTSAKHAQKVGQLKGAKGQ
ncbi:mannose-1-phosphate guanylyltransferase [Altererythrobacter sp. BO-6]|uniref:mannose-1-phosphate guanylyltransferase n=1 Tax=Altererythrobacter sp. BO-6 TaxID=2604537 RepID=UPI0013E16900|nr:sugar phosphate nucleotidyltransferase [Altererythrobacter sp. BO-6]QIG54277.1 mannose-1-phosphate guanylyltransferase [Altererythrobacter sp. BO-6]